jgi:hypothetical protein
MTKQPASKSFFAAESCDNVIIAFYSTYSGKFRASRNLVAMSIVEKAYHSI